MLIVSIILVDTQKKTKNVEEMEGYVLPNKSVRKSTKCGLVLRQTCLNTIPFLHPKKGYYCIGGGGRLKKGVGYFNICISARMLKNCEVTEYFHFYIYLLQYAYLKLNFFLCVSMIIWF